MVSQPVEALTPSPRPDGRPSPSRRGEGGEGFFQIVLSPYSTRKYGNIIMIGIPSFMGIQRYDEVLVDGAQIFYKILFLPEIL